MKSYLFLFIVFATFSISTSAQIWDWARRGAGAYNYGISTDQEGNVYVTGSFTDTASFDQAASPLIAKGKDDIFVAKYDPSGNLLWARACGSKEIDRALAIVTIPTGGCYVTGYFNDTAFFSNDTLIASIMTDDAFIAKYDDNGNLVWLRQGGGIYDDYGKSIATDKYGNCYITGYFRNEAFFDSKTVTHTGTFIGGESDMFVAKYDSSGNALWVKGAGGTQAYADGNGISVDADGNAYITGSFSSTCVFDTISVTAVPSIAGLGGEDDIFVAKYDSSGSALWVRTAGGGGDPLLIHSPDEGYGICTDSAGNSYVTGMVHGTVNFDTLVFTSVGEGDIFTAKYDKNGSLLWAHTSGGSNRDYGTSISIDAAGNSYIGGAFMNAFNFGPVPVAPAGSSTDAFIASYDNTGHPRWLLPLGGNSSDWCSAVDIDAVGKVYIAGLFSSSSIMFDPTLLNGSGNDGFTAKLSNLPTGLQMVGNTAPLLSVYPNPAHTSINVKGEGIEGMTLCDITGKVLRTAIKGETSINITGLNRGVYLLNIQTTKGQTVRKIQVE